MKTVKKEWSAVKTEQQKADWASKWADLLLETWNNPIWVAGYNKARIEFEDQMENLEQGEYPEKLISEKLENYAKALQVLNSTLSVVSGSIQLPGKTPEELVDIALEKISAHLSQYLDFDEETNTVTFEIVMVN
jgi:hypothetical protein